MSSYLRHCARRDCQCTHTEPCEYGWVELEPTTKHGVPYARVAPCPTCRPQAADRLAATLRATSYSLPEPTRPGKRPGLQPWRRDAPAELDQDEQLELAP